MTETFDTFDPKPGEVVHLEPGIRLIVAPNPSPMTFLGKNTYLLGTQDVVVVVDPGPDQPAHLDAILAALDAGETVSVIIVTHTHIDHSPLARPLQDRTGAEILALGDATAGRSPVMARLAASGLVGGGEGIDCAFQPDRRVKDGDQIVADGGTIDVIHTPGHLGNHIALGWRDACLTADHVMGWASPLVSPPDGDLTEFMASCHRLRARDWRAFYPGHGAPISDPGGRLNWLISQSRRARSGDSRCLA